MCFTVYKTVHANGEVEFTAYSEDFLNSPYVIGGSPFWVLLPGGWDGKHWFTYIEAESEHEAETKAIAKNDWQYSRFNWETEPA